MRKLLLFALIAVLLAVTADRWVGKLMDALWQLVDQNVYNYRR